MSDEKDLVKQQFGAHAAAYATSRVHAQGASLARLVELLQPRPEWQALDIATAAGHTAFAIAPHVASVVAADITPEMMGVGQEQAAKRGITNVRFETADAEALPYADAAFDLVTCRIAPHHFPHVDRFIAEAHRVLRPGGWFAVVDNVVPEGEAGDYVNAFEKLRDPSHGRCWSVAEWLAGFAAAGFTVTNHETADKTMTFADWAARMGASPETIAELRRRLVDAPAAAAAFLRPTPQGDDLLLTLEEAIIIGHKVTTTT
jgi:ubiquinone/menaquinone biosynthesis C-methylase UbiE